MSIFRPYRRRHGVPIFKLQHGSYAVATLTPSVSFQKRNVSRQKRNVSRSFKDVHHKFKYYNGAHQ